MLDDLLFRPHAYVLIKLLLIKNAKVLRLGFEYIQVTFFVFKSVFLNDFNFLDKNWLFNSSISHGLCNSTAGISSAHIDFGRICCLVCLLGAALWSLLELRRHPFIFRIISLKHGATDVFEDHIERSSYFDLGLRLFEILRLFRISRVTFGGLSPLNSFRWQSWHLLGRFWNQELWRFGAKYLLDVYIGN